MSTAITATDLEWKPELAGHGICEKHGIERRR